MMIGGRWRKVRHRHVFASRRASLWRRAGEDRPDPHPLARTEQPGLIGTSQPSFDPPGPPRDLPPVIPFPNSTISGRCGL